MRGRETSLCLFLLLLLPLPRGAFAGKGRDSVLGYSLGLLLYILPGLVSWATHSLQYFHTAVSNPEPGLPAYASVGYLDDNLFVECDSDSGLFKPRAQWIKDNVGADYWESGTKLGIAQQQVFRTSMRILMERYNQTGGFHTLQRRSGCEIRKDGSIGGSRQLAYDGDDFLSFDMNTSTWVAAVKEAEITQRRWNADTADLQYRKQYTEKECIEWLRKYHRYGKEALQGREPAAVEVSGKATPDGLTRRSCRVYGFYPRDIAVTWMKNGETREQETQRGDILPSGDGTYQIQATLEIDPKEGGRYSCLVDHSSLLEPFNVFWEPKSNVIPIVAGVIMVAAVLAAIVGIIIWRKIGSGKKGAGYLPPGSHRLEKSPRK
ncbi:major histocompatibility complex class I-related gene protein-like [Mauremys reevesii]|uniref:major histocompatibility complex class I-related gene protein-like n=1 Tax=Mauremys reevesii TaxID=260615 RepID=UPI00193EEB4D|nr:major histocompatibility complex class I-related gene protein-like [Mauremys reevesii]